MISRRTKRGKREDFGGVEREPEEVRLLNEIAEADGAAGGKCGNDVIAALTRR